MNLSKACFSIKHRLKPQGKACQSLPILQQFAQLQFLGRYQQLEQNLKYAGVPYAIKLLRTSDRLLGKRQKLTKGNIDMELNTKALREKVYLKMLEEADDRQNMDDETLVQACYLIEEYQFNAEQSRAVKELYNEVIRRSFMMNQSDINKIHTIFSRISNLSVLKFVPDLKNDIKKKYGAGNKNELIADYLYLKNPQLSYNPDITRFTVHKEGIKYTVQGVSNYSKVEMEKVINCLGREKYDLVLLTLPNDGKKKLLENVEDIDNEMNNYLRVKNKYKGSETERVVYERVNGLRNVNINLSVLYSFSTMGNKVLDLPIGLIIPPSMELIPQAKLALNAIGREVDRVYNLMKDYVFLDQMEWLSLVCQVDGCPQCKTESINYVPDLSYPLIRHMTNKEINRSFMTRSMVKNIQEMAQPMKQGDKTLKVLIFVDDEYADIVDIGHRLLKEEEPDVIQVSAVDKDEYLKLSLLFDGHRGDDMLFDNETQFAGLWKDMFGMQVYENLEAHKYDYKCFPVALLKDSKLIN